MAQTHTLAVFLAQVILLLAVGRLLGELMQRIGQTRNEEAQAAAALAGLEREAERLVSESDIAKQELETLGLQRGQVALSFESVTERLKRLEAEIAELRLQLEASRAEESQSKRRGDQLRG